jgi:hypothetical protein
MDPRRSGQLGTAALLNFPMGRQAGMPDILRVRWTITSQTLPEPWLACSRCSGVRPFRCSEKFRLNANGKRLDAWLIYRCAACEETWNRPLFERRRLNEIDPAMLEALQANDRDRARSFAFDVAGLRPFTSHIDGSNDVVLRKDVVAAPPRPASRIEIQLVLSGATRLRLDRLLAGGLGLSRARIGALHEKGCLTIAPGAGKALRRPPHNGQRILLDRADEDVPAIWVAAAR